MMSKSLKIGIVGLGVMGKNHCRVLKSLPEANIVALCDPYVKDGYEEKIYTVLDDLLSNESIDAAVIATPTSLHRETAIKCIAKGVHVLIEKPVASNIGEGEEILRAASEKDTKVAVGYIERFNPVVRALKEELSDKEIYSVSITRVGPFPPRISDVGVLTDIAIHDIDLIRFITSKKIKDANIFKSRKIHDHHEDNAILSFKLDGDIVASIITNWLTPFKRRKIEVATSDAYYEADLIGQDLVRYSSYNMDSSYVVKNHSIRKQEPLGRELAAFIDFVKNGSVQELATIEDSIETLRIIETTRHNINWGDNLENKKR